MTPDPLEPATEYPEMAKVRALKLPMKTIKDFLRWMQKEYPGVPIRALDVDAALYKYYNIDTAKLTEELPAMLAALQKTRG